MTSNNLKKRMKIQLMEYANDTKQLANQMKHFNKGPAKQYLQITMPVGYTNSALNGLLVFENLLTRVSEDVLKILSSIIDHLHIDCKQSVGCLDIVLSSFEQGEQDLKALFEFYETLQYTVIAFEIGAAFTGDGINPPTLAAVYMANPEVMNEIFLNDDWETNFDNKIYDDLWDVLFQAKNGEEIYEKFNAILTASLSNSTKE